MAEEIIDEAAQAVRRPPSSVLSEQAILAGLMIDNSALDSVVDIISIGATTASFLKKSCSSCRKDILRTI